MPTKQQCNLKAIEPLQLKYSVEGQRVVVTPGDNDRFILSMNEAITACKIFDQLNIVKFGPQFEKLIQKLASWIDTHEGDISKAFVTTRDSGLLFLVATKKPEFDQKLEGELTELDIAVASDEDFDLIQLSVLILPSDSPDAVDCFVDKSNLMVYAK